MNKIFFILLFVFSGFIYAFELTDINGKVWQKEALKGQYIIVNFWATWCPPCLEEMPLLNEIAQQYSSSITLLGINHWDSVSKQALNDFLDVYFVDYPIILSKEKINQSTIKTFGQLRGLPTTFIYSPSGKLITKFEGELDKIGLSNFIPIKTTTLDVNSR